MQFILSKMKGSAGLMMTLIILCVCWAGTTAFAQQATVTGKVTSGEDKTTMPGVNVIVKGTANGTVTDQNGNYSISAPPDAVLVFSFVGFTSYEAAVGNRSTVDIELATDAKQLTEVVVTALGIRKDVKTVGFANQMVQGSELTQAREPNTVNSLVGKVAGLSIGSSPELLGRPNIVLRGNTDVLFVVNGVPIEFRYVEPSCR